jgi:hypothetical protein
MHSLVILVSLLSSVIDAHVSLVIPVSLHSYVIDAHAGPAH